MGPMTFWEKKIRFYQRYKSDLDKEAMKAQINWMSPLAQSLIKAARKEIGYSDKTVGADIYAGLIKMARQNTVGFVKPRKTRT